METLLFGLNGLLLILIWRLMLKKSILDAHRDRLFDMRDALRSKFVSQEWSMSSPLYRRLRDQINAYLRFTETYSFGEFIRMEHQFNKRPELVKAAMARSSVVFENCTAAEHEFMEEFRRDAVGIMTSYMILSSGPLMVAMIFILPIAAILRLLGFCGQQLTRGGRTISSKALQVRDLVIACNALAISIHWQIILAVKTSVGFLARKLLYPDILEQYSYDHARKT